MTDGGKAAPSIVSWRRAHRDVEAALRLLATATPELPRAATHLRSAWQHVLEATNGVVPNDAAGSRTVASRPTPPEVDPAGAAAPDDDDEASSDGSDADATETEDPSPLTFARDWLRQHYGDDAHVEGACLPWLFPTASGASVAPMPAELRTHGLWLRYRILDHIARREGIGRQALAVVAVAFVAMLGAVLVGELAGPDLPWKGEYFDNEDFKGKPKIEFADKVEFDFGRGAPLESIPKDEFSVRWTTCLQVDETAEFAFELTSDDGSRLFVDGVQVIDNWGAHGKRARDGSIELEDGPHLMEVEYFDRRYGGRVFFKYDAEGGKDFVTVPAESLKPPEDGDDPCD